MSEKTKKIIYWVLTGLVGIVFIGSALGKLSGSAEGIKAAEGFGIGAGAFRTLGIVELISILLFIFPRTGILGTILLVGYMGGAIATHLEHAQSIVAPIVITSFVCLVAVYRFPEMLNRIKNKG